MYRIHLGLPFLHFILDGIARSANLVRRSPNFQGPDHRTQSHPRRTPGRTSHQARSIETTLNLIHRPSKKLTVKPDGWRLVPGQSDMILPEVSVYPAIVELLLLMCELPGRLRLPYPYLRPVHPSKTQVSSSPAGVQRVIRV